MLSRVRGSCNGKSWRKSRSRPVATPELHRRNSVGCWWVRASPHFSPGGLGIGWESVCLWHLAALFWGNLQGTDCAGRAWACLGSNTRDDCCRRLRGSGDGAIGFQWLAPGLRPRLSVDAAFAAYSNPRLAPGDYSINPVPLQCRDFGESGEAAVGLAHPRKRPLQVFLIKRRSRASTSPSGRAWGNPEGAAFGNECSVLLGAEA